MKAVINLKNLQSCSFFLVGPIKTPIPAEDNEVLLDLTGDNLTLTILQAGYGNTLSWRCPHPSDSISYWFQV